MRGNKQANGNRHGKASALPDGSASIAWISRQRNDMAVKLERAKGFEPSTPTLARSCSTPELHPHPCKEAGGGYPSAAPPMPKRAADCNTRIKCWKSKRSGRSSGRPGRHPGTARIDVWNATQKLTNGTIPLPNCGNANSNPRQLFAILRIVPSRTPTCRPLPTTCLPSSTGLGIAHKTVSHPPLFTVEQSQALRGDDSRRAHQESVPEGQEGRGFPGRGRPRTAKIDLKSLHRHAGRHRALSVRVGRPDARTARCHARLGDGLRGDQR